MPPPPLPCCLGATDQRYGKGRGPPDAGGLRPFIRFFGLDRRTPRHRYQPVTRPGLLHIGHTRGREVETLHHPLLARRHVIQFLACLYCCGLSVSKSGLPVRVAHEQCRRTRHRLHCGRYPRAASWNDSGRPLPCSVRTSQGRGPPPSAITLLFGCYSVSAGDLSE
jgi:hypothetical protein